jgi:hypothetical protein
MASCHSQVSVMLRTLLALQKPHIPASFNMYLVINKCVTPVKVSNFSGHYLRNRSTLDIRNTLPKSGTFLLGHSVYVMCPCPLLFNSLKAIEISRVNYYDCWLNYWIWGEILRKIHFSTREISLSIKQIIQKYPAVMNWKRCWKTSAHLLRY